MTSRVTVARVAALWGMLAALSGCGGGTPFVPANASPGQRVFAHTNCGSCHTLAAANSTGTVGKKLDGLSLDVPTVERWVRTGGGGMPTFQGQLTDTQIQQVAEFVARSSHAKP